MSLRNKLIVVTRSEKGSKEWQEQLTKQGATVYNLPTISMTPVKPNRKLSYLLHHIDDFYWVVFTSASGIRYLSILAKEISLDLSTIKLPKLAVIGEQTAMVARATGFQVVFQPTIPSSLTLGEELKPVGGKSILLLRTTIASSDLAKQLTQRGGIVTDLPIYQTTFLHEPDPKFSELLDSNKIDYITFASPSAVSGFCQRLTKLDLTKAKTLQVVAIGPVVAAELQGRGFKKIHTSIEPTVEGIIKIIAKFPRSFQ